MLDQMIAKAESYRQHEVDIKANAKDICFGVSDGAMHVKSDIGNVALSPTRWAQGQIYGRLEPVIFSLQPNDEDHTRGRKSWKDYLDTCPTLLREVNLNYWLAQTDQDWLIRTYDNNARAVLSSRFAKADILECLQWTKQALDSQKGEAFKFFNVFQDENTLRLSIAVRDMNIPDGGRGRGGVAPYAIGVDIGTGEIGNRKIYVNPFVMRTSCTNSITWAKSEFSMDARHVGVKSDLSQTFAICVFRAIGGCEDVLRGLVASLDEPLPNLNKMIEDMAKRNRWSQELAYAVAVGTEGDNSLWGLVEGVSAAANSTGDPELQLDLHSLAGTLLMGNSRGLGDEL